VAINRSPRMAEYRTRSHRLALGEIAVKTGKLTEGHAALKADAAAKGFGSIVKEVDLIIGDVERQASRK